MLVEAFESDYAHMHLNMQVWHGSHYAHMDIICMNGFWI